ncbi:quinon protein alcohol dehydrogenase-like superfamily [Hygrophoropsis aurantiaca]|uniref:Quinon protein alcohol dehydrogenase-like superfamily n=1 Tax=Hygrophoropsis aurantiaca TaxID=72124 RepID=A0ACB8A745_9AGAM|nr:quinon protein alcohol dehydrogenase-like superfamily [Hygrophoropsis aurantiaca]
MSTSASPELEEDPSPASHLPIKTFKGHTDTVLSVRYFKNGKWMASQSRDGTVRIWDVESGNQIGKSLAQKKPARSMDISPNDQKLAIGKREWITLLDLESGKAQLVWRTNQGQTDGLCVAFLPGGTMIAARHISARGIVFLDVDSGECVKELHLGKTFTRLAFSPDESRLAVVLFSQVEAFDVASGETVCGPFAGFNSFSSVIWTSDGQQIITASDSTESVRLWDYRTGREVDGPKTGPGSLHIALSPDGRLLGSRVRGTIRLWDLSARQQLGNPLRTQTKSWLFSFAWSPDGQAVVAGDFGRTGDIYLWDISPFVPVDSDQVTLSTSRSRPNSISSDILNLAAGPPPTSPPPQHLELNTSPASGEDENWEYFTDESFDSVLDLPADGKHLAQRRKRRRRRAAPVAEASASPHPISVVPNPHTIPNFPNNPRQKQAPAPPSPEEPASDAHTEPGGSSSPSHAPTKTRLWGQALTLLKWTRTHKKPRKDCDEPHKTPPDHSASPTSGPGTPFKPSAHNAKASNTAPDSSLPSLFSRVRARFSRDKRTPEEIEMRPPQEIHLPKYSRVTKVALAEADARLYTPKQKKEPEPEDSDDAASEESIRDDGCLNAICFCEYLKWRKYRRELRKEEQQRQERRERKGQERQEQERLAQQHEQVQDQVNGENKLVGVSSA